MRDPDEQQYLNESLYQYAHSKFSLRRVEELLAEGADVEYIHHNYRGDSLGSVLEVAIKSRSLALVRLLLDHGAKVTANTLRLVSEEEASAQEMIESPFATLDRSADEVLAEVVSSRKIAALIRDAAIKQGVTKRPRGSKKDNPQP